METIEEAQTAVDKAQATFDRITERYNREYMAGLWSTNRPLAAASENAYDALHRAKVALAAFDEPACPHCDRTGVYIGRDITPGECLSEHRVGAA